MPTISRITGPKGSFSRVVAGVHLSAFAALAIAAFTAPAMAQPCTSCAVTGGDIGKWVPQMSSGTVITTPVLTANLPTCSAALKGASSAVTDATSPTFNATLTGGGAVFTPVICNGTNWVTN